jgi:hypothetical protein
MNLRKIGATVLGAALVGGAVAAGWASAQIPSSADGTITACMLKATGTLRVIDAQSGAACFVTETKLTWGGAPKPSGVHWLKTDTNHNVTASSEPLSYSYGSSSYGLYQFPAVDLNKCAITSEISDQPYRAATIASYAYNYYGYLYVGAINADRVSVSGVPIDVTVTCGTT